MIEILVELLHSAETIIMQQEQEFQQQIIKVNDDLERIDEILNNRNETRLL